MPVRGSGRAPDTALDPSVQLAARRPSRQGAERRRVSRSPAVSCLHAWSSGPKPSCRAARSRAGGSELARPLGSHHRRARAPRSPTCAEARVVFRPAIDGTARRPRAARPPHGAPSSVERGALSACGSGLLGRASRHETSRTCRRSSPAEHQPPPTHTRPSTRAEDLLHPPGVRPGPVSLLPIARCRPPPVSRGRPRAARTQKRSAGRSPASTRRRFFPRGQAAALGD